MYCGHMGVELPENWNFYMAFAFFRLAAMLQGLCKHSLAGEEPNHASTVPHLCSHQCGKSSKLNWGRSDRQNVPQGLGTSGCESWEL